MAKRNKKNSKVMRTVEDMGIIPFNSRSQGKKGDWHPLQEEDKREQKYVKNVKARSVGQQALMDSMKERDLTFAVGPAGSGKTYLAIASAVDALEAEEVDRIILSRPAIESGESLGFLPGDLAEKMAPFLRPLYDALNDRLGAKRLKKYMEEGVIEIAPVGYMRGRTLNNSFVVIDEAQNCTYAQLKMLLTRLGWNSTMVITGDPDQSDLLEGISGLRAITEKVDEIEKIGVIRLTSNDIVRHPLVAEMLDVL